jgi:hypothetical protein
MTTQTDGLADDYLEALKTHAWLEGTKYHMYLDAPLTGSPNVTVGIGHLIPSAADAAALSFTEKGIRADEKTIKSTYNEVKIRKPTTHKLVLSQDDVDSLAKEDIDKKINLLKKRFPNFDDFPRLAQKGLLDVQYNVKKFSEFKNFIKAADEGNWSEAARHNRRYPGSAGVYPRNAMVAAWFCQAAEGHRICKKFKSRTSPGVWPASPERTCNELFCPCSIGNEIERDSTFCYKYSQKVQSEGWPSYEEKYCNGGFCPLTFAPQGETFCDKFKQQIQEKGWPTFEDLLDGLVTYQSNLPKKIPDAEFLKKLKELDKVFTENS